MKLRKGGRRNDCLGDDLRRLSGRTDPGKEIRSVRVRPMRRTGIFESISYSRRNVHTGGSVDSARVEDARGYGLVTRSHQSKAVVPCMGTCIRWSEAVRRGKHGCRIGTGERYDAIDDGIPRIPNRDGHGNREGRTCRCIGGAEKLRIACGLPQPSGIESATAVVRAHSRRAGRTTRGSKCGNRPRKITSKRRKSEFCTVHSMPSNRTQTPR